MAAAKPQVVVSSPYAEVVSPYVVGATSSQYVARSVNPYAAYVAETPYIPTYPYAYSSYVL
jgi:hypothetical protein